MSAWQTVAISGSASSLHGFEVTGPSRVARVCMVDAPALVLGSTQSDEVVDHDAVTAAGIEVVRRRAGGGAVLVVPGGQVWLDVWLPVGDPLLVADVARSFDWLGRAWCAALADLHLDAAVHTGSMRPGPWGRLVCFGGLGPGEVTVAGAKAVGIAQRRGRAGARFHSAALLEWRPADLIGLLALSPRQRRSARRDLSGAASALPVDGDSLVRRVLAHLP